MRLRFVVTLACAGIALVSRSTVAKGLEAPRGMAFDRAGNLFVSGNDSIVRFTPDGSWSSFASGLKSPFDLAFDKEGNLFAAETGAGAILKFAPDGKKSTFATASEPVGLAFDSTGNLFVIDIHEMRGSILKFAPDGKKTVFFTTITTKLGSTKLVDSAGPVFDKAGNLFVSDRSSGTGQILKFTPDGTRSTFASGLGHPLVLAFDEAGNLYVSSEEAEITGVHTQILKFAPDGTRSTLATAPVPVGLALNGSGNLFVFDAQSHSILKFSPDGTKSTFAWDVTSASPDKKWEFVGGAEPQILNAATKQVALGIDKGEGAVAWAPDSKRFAFSSAVSGRRGYVLKSVVFYELRDDKWQEIGSPTDETSGSQLVQLLKEQPAKKFNSQDCSSNSDVVELHEWTDASTAIVYAPCYRRDSDKVKAAFLFTLKFDAAGKWKIVKTYQMSDKEIAKMEKAR